MLWYFRKDHNPDYECARVLEECANKNLDHRIITPSEIDIVVTRSDRKSISVDGKSVSMPKSVLARTGSGTGYQALSVLRHLERLHVPVYNKSDAIEAVKDKLYTTQILAQAGIPVPRTMLVRFPVNIELVEKQIGFPCVIKVLSGSYGKGIHLVQTPKGLEELMEFVASLNSPLNILIQEYIGHKPGSDLRVLVIGNRVVGAMMRTSTDGDFRANISRGGHGENFAVDQEIVEIALGTAAHMGLDIGGVDLLFDENGYRVCEANSSPGFEGFEQATGINVAEHIVDYITSK